MNQGRRLVRRIGRGGQFVPRGIDDDYKLGLGLPPHEVWARLGELAGASGKSIPDTLEELVYTKSVPEIAKDIGSSVRFLRGLIKDYRLASKKRIAHMWFENVLGVVVIIAIGSLMWGAASGSGDGDTYYPGDREGDTYYPPDLSPPGAR